MSNRSSSSSSASSSSSTEDKNNNNNNSKYFERQSKYKNLTPEEFWKLKKKERKERVRERNRDKKEQKNKQWDDMSPEEQEKVRAEAAEKHEQKRKEQNEFNEACAANLNNDQTPAIVFDLHFATSMNLRDVKSTTNQIKLGCSSMRKERYILKPIFVSGVDETKKTSTGVTAANGNGNDDDANNHEEQQQKQHPGNEIFPHLQNFDGFKKFPHEFLRGQVTTVLDPKKTVYLTADSPNVLWELKPGENYVIGAFVDHNTMKNATFNYATKDLRADEVGLRHARLPLDESILVGNRCKVLTINHVVDVLLNFMKTKSWKEAILGNLPTRRVENTTNTNDDTNVAHENSAPMRRERVEEENHHQHHRADDEMK